MAVALGTNAGFVTTAPVADPTGTPFEADTRAFAVKHTCPVGKTLITEIGWWCDNATEATNFEVGLYSDDAGNVVPEALLFSDTTNAKGTTSGWKTATVAWTVTPGTIYWIAVQVDDTATTTNHNYSAGGYYTNDAPLTTLQNPWPHGTAAGALTFAIYAKVAAGYSELSGTIASVSNVSGNLDTTEITTLAGTIAATSTVSGNLGSTSVDIEVETFFIKRLIVAGKDRIYYEDI